MAKMSTLMLTAAAFVAIFFQVSTADTITCYVCNSATDGNDKCGDTSFKKDGLATCTGAQCFKTTASVTLLGVSSSTTTRGCYPALDSTNNNKCNGAGVSGLGSGTTCLCNSNNCNAATSIYPGLVALAAALIMAYIGRRLL